MQVEFLDCIARERVVVWVMLEPRVEIGFQNR